MMRMHPFPQGCQVHSQPCCPWLSEDDISLISSSLFEVKDSKTFGIIKSQHANGLSTEPQHAEVGPDKPLASSLAPLCKHRSDLSKVTQWVRYGARGGTQCRPESWWDPWEKYLAFGIQLTCVLIPALPLTISVKQADLQQVETHCSLFHRAAWRIRRINENVPGVPYTQRVLSKQQWLL